jgi:hypothetical protein
MKIDYMKKLKLLVAALLAGWTALAGPTHKV